MRQSTEYSFDGTYERYLYNSCFKGGEAGYACMIAASRILRKVVSLYRSGSAVVETYQDLDSTGPNYPDWMNGERNMEHVLLWKSPTHFNAFVPREAIASEIWTLDDVWLGFLEHKLFEKGTNVGIFPSLNDKALLTPTSLLVRCHAVSDHSH